MRKTHEALGTLEAKLVKLLNRNFELPVEIISVAKEYHIALVSVFSRIDQLSIGELVPFHDLEASLSKPTQALKEMLDSVLAAGMPITSMDHLQQKGGGS